MYGNAGNVISLIHVKYWSSQSTSGESPLWHAVYIRLELGEIQGMVGELQKGVFFTGLQIPRRKEGEKFRGDTRV